MSDRLPTCARFESCAGAVEDGSDVGADVGADVSVGRGAEVGPNTADFKNEREVFILRGGCGLEPSPSEDEVLWLISEGRCRRSKIGCDCEGNL